MILRQSLKTIRHQVGEITTLHDSGHEQHVQFCRHEGGEQTGYTIHGSEGQDHCG